VTIRRGVNWFDEDFETSRNKFFGSDSESFVGYGDDLPVNVLFTTLVTTAPIDVTLAISFVGPVFSLTLFGAVGPLLATATQFGGKPTKLEAIGTVPSNKIFFLPTNAVT